MLKRFLSIGILALVSLYGARGADQQSATPPELTASVPFQISVSLNLVVLPVTVLKKKGGYAADLHKENFDVFEDNVRQNVRLFRNEDIPVAVGLVVDHSGSMQSKMDDVLTAARVFVTSSNPEDQMFVVNFNERVSLGLPADTPFTDRLKELEAAIQLAPSSGETALYDAVSVALDEIKSGNREKKVLIVISDGGDNASVTDLRQVLKKAEQSDVLVYTIGIFGPNDTDQNPGVLKRLAHETGGEAFFPAQFKDVAGICENIAKEIRHQYTLGYVSTNSQPGGRRAIRVVAHAPGMDLIVRTRAGYIPTPDEGK